MDIKLEERYLYCLYDFYQSLDTSFMEQLSNFALPPILSDDNDNDHPEEDNQQQTESTQNPTSPNTNENVETNQSQSYQSETQNQTQTQSQDSEEISLPPEDQEGRETSVTFPASRETPSLNPGLYVPVHNLNENTDTTDLRINTTDLPEASDSQKTIPTLQSIADFQNEASSSGNNGPKSKKQNYGLEVPEISKEEGPRKMYIGFLLINPIKVNLSFSLSKHGNGVESDLVRFFRGLGFVVVSVNQAPLRLNALSLRHVFGSTDEILQPLKKHYIQQAIREGYKVLGSFDFLGNPVGLFHSLGTGVIDFFVEPSKGIVLSPKDFKEGLQKGSKSLLSNTFYGVLNTTTKLTQSTARGLATLSLDEEYLQEREHFLREHPNNFLEGVIQGGRAAMVGIQHGVTGIISKPIQGAQKEGAKGLFKGIGKGITGVAAKPTAGAFDLVSKTSEGLRNSTKPNSITERKRMPRYFPPDGTLSTYSPSKSYGQYLLFTSTDLEKIKGQAKSICGYTTENYHSHVIYDNRTTLMFTNRRILCFGDTRGIIKKWEVCYQNISKVNEVEGGVRILLKSAIPRGSGILWWKKVPYFMVKCTDGAARKFLFERILYVLEIHSKSI